MAQIESFGDAVLMTYNQDRPHNRFTIACQDYRNYEFNMHAWRRKRSMESAGIRIERQIMKAQNNNARWIEMTTPDVVNWGDLMASAFIPWRIHSNGLGVDEMETAFTREPAQKVSLVKTRKVSFDLEILKLREDAGWQTVASSTDSLNFWGNLLWIQTGTTLKAFSGGNPSGFANGLAEIDSAAIPQWANYYDTYAAISRDDLINSLDQAATETNWQPVVDGVDYREGRGDRQRICTGEVTIRGFRRRAEEQNENLDTDLNPFNDRTITVGGLVTVGVHALNSLDSGRTLLGINYADSKIECLSGWYEKTYDNIQHPEFARQFRRIEYTVGNYLQTRRNGTFRLNHT